MRYEIRIQAGMLTLETRREDMPLDTLLSFASRQNPKRGFLFVSKVLGKHIPCRPFQMRAVYDRLAAQLQGLPGPIVVIGMAETATGLGGGVADSLARQEGRDDIFYIHTTRHWLTGPVLITFDESHSHAPDHILYAPQGERAELFARARSLVLVDDEISTGRTLRLLAERVAVHMPRLRRILLAAIVNWLDLPQQRGLMAGARQEIRLLSLLEGSFGFRPNPDFRPALPPRLSACRRSLYARHDTGRTGLIMPHGIDHLPAGPVPQGPLVMVGTGEFTFAPFLAAERLEEQGHNVLFQSTTRSPIVEGDAISRKLIFTDEQGEGIANYIYNLPTDRSVIVAYEHPAMAAAHDFPGLVAAQLWALPRAATGSVAA